MDSMRPLGNNYRLDAPCMRIETQQIGDRQYLKAEGIKRVAAYSGHPERQKVGSP